MSKFKIPIILMIVLGLGFYPLFQARAVVVIIDPAFIAKEFTLDLVARALAHGILKTISNNVVQRIATSGRDGGPAFVQNWRNFSLQAQYRGEDIWRGLLYIAVNGNPNTGVSPILCSHLRNNQAIQSLQPREVPGLIESGLNRRVDSLQDTLVSLQCDPIIEARYETYKQDFVQGGGWDTFARLLSAKHRPEGVTGILFNELEKQRRVEKEADVNEALSASGFTGLRTGCISISPTTNQCTIFGQVVTPGDIFGESVAQTINQNLAFVATADEFEEVVITLISSLVDRVFIGAGLTQTTPLEELRLPPQQIPQFPGEPKLPKCRLVETSSGSDIVCDSNGGGSGGNGGGGNGNGKQ